MKSKILVFAGATYVFGAEKITLNVINGLHKKGYNLHILVSAWNDGDFINRLKDLNITSFDTIRLGWYYLTKPLWSLDSFFYFPKGILKFLKISRQFKPDLIYTTSFRPLVLLYPLINTKVIYNVPDPNSESRQGRFFIKLVDRKVTKYTACSEYIKKDLIKCGIGAEKIEVVHNSINPKDFNINHKKKIDLNKIVLGIVGQVIPRKGHEDAIDALNLLIKKGFKNIFLQIIGTGDVAFETNLKEKIQEYKLDDFVEWKGYVKEYLKIYKDIDILIVPTRNNEPFGLIAIEANILKIPVIASNKGGLPEIIEEGFNGYLVNPNDPTDIAQKIELLLETNNLIALMGANGRSRVLERFTEDIMIEKLSKIFNKS